VNTPTRAGYRACIPNSSPRADGVQGDDWVAETITIFGSTGFIQPGGAMNMLGAGLTLAWILAFGFWGGLSGRY
jgi:hypothetical protein